MHFEFQFLRFVLFYLYYILHVNIKGGKNICMCEYWTYPLNIGRFESENSEDSKNRKEKKEEFVLKNLLCFQMNIFIYVVYIRNELNDSQYTSVVFLLIFFTSEKLKKWKYFAVPFNGGCVGVFLLLWWWSSLVSLMFFFVVRLPFSLCCYYSIFFSYSCSVFAFSMGIHYLCINIFTVLYDLFYLNSIWPTFFFIHVSCTTQLHTEKWKAAKETAGCIFFVRNSHKFSHVKCTSYTYYTILFIELRLKVKRAFFLLNERKTSFYLYINATWCL